MREHTSVIHTHLFHVDKDDEACSNLRVARQHQDDPLEPLLRLLPRVGAGGAAGDFDTDGGGGGGGGMQLGSIATGALLGRCSFKSGAVERGASSAVLSESARTA